MLSMPAHGMLVVFEVFVNLHSEGASVFTGDAALCAARLLAPITPCNPEPQPTELAAGSQLQL